MGISPQEEAGYDLPRNAEVILRKRGRQASAVAGPSSHGAAVAQGAGAAEVLGRRSRVASCVACVLCGGLLRDAAVIPECLHSFCRECIVKEFTDKNINRCPKCDIDLGCNPLEKLRADHRLPHIRSVIFPDKRHRGEEISHIHLAFVSPPSPSNQAHEVDHSAKKSYAHLMGHPMNPVTETVADKSLGMEPSSSLEKSTASSPQFAAALGAEPTWPDGCGNRLRDEQREEASSACVEPQRAVEGSGIEEFESEHHGLLDKQAATQERNELTNEMDPWIAAVEGSKTRMTTDDEEWSTEGWTTAMTRVEVGREVVAERANAAATTAREEADDARVLELVSARALERVSALTAQVEAERARAQSLEDEVVRLRRELLAARVSEADDRRQVADQQREAETTTAEMTRRAVDNAGDRLEEEYGQPPTEEERAVAVETAEYVLACCLSRDPAFRPEVVLEGVVAADEVEERVLRDRARETALRVAEIMIRIDDGDGVDA